MGVISWVCTRWELAQKNKIALQHGIGSAGMRDDVFNIETLIFVQIAVDLLWLFKLDLQLTAYYLKF